MEPTTRPRIFFCWAPVTLALAALIGNALYISSFGVNVPFWDEWELGKFYERFYRGQLPMFELLTAKHNEHLIGIAFAVMLFHHLLTGFDVKAILYFNMALQVVSLALLLRMSRTSLPTDSRLWWHGLALTLLLLSFAPYTNILWGFQTAWYLVTVLLMLTLYCLVRSTSSTRPASLIFLAAIFALLASFCSVQGLAVWVAGVVFLVTAREGRLISVPTDWRVRLWAACAVVGVGLYSLASSLTPTAGPTSRSAILAALADPLALAKFVLLALGTVGGDLPVRWSYATGLLVVLVAVMALAFALRSGDRARSALPVALIAFGATCILMIAAGRLPLGVGAARESRYSTYVLLLLAGTYLIFARGGVGAVARVPAVILARNVLVGLIGGSFVLAAYFALVHGHAWRTERGIGALVLLNYATEPSFRIERTLYGNAPFVVAQANFLQSTAQSAFSEGLSAVPSSACIFARPPAGYQEIIDNYPTERDALLRLWDAYVVGPDVRNAFPVGSNMFSFNIIRWASGAARDGGHYLSPALKDFAPHYERLYKTLESRMRS